MTSDCLQAWREGIDHARTTQRGSDTAASVRHISAHLASLRVSAAHLAPLWKVRAQRCATPCLPHARGVFIQCQVRTRAARIGRTRKHRSEHGRRSKWREGSWAHHGALTRMIVVRTRLPANSTIPTYTLPPAALSIMMRWKVIRRCRSSGIVHRNSGTWHTRAVYI